MKTATIAAAILAFCDIAAGASHFKVRLYYCYGRQPLASTFTLSFPVLPFSTPSFSSP